MKKIKLTSEKTALLCREMQLIIRSGLEAGGALSLTAAESDDADIKAVAQQLAETIDGGESLASAIKASGAFPEYVCALSEVGRNTGKSEEAFGALADHYFRQDRLERGLKNALLYPGMLILVMLGVVVLLLTKVLPVFDEAYARLGASLGGVAFRLLQLGQWFSAALPFVCLLMAVAVAFLACFALSDAFRAKILGTESRSDRGLAGKMLRARFAGALAMGLQSGMRSEEALELASLTLKGSIAARRCLECGEELARGEALGAALRKSGLLPAGQSRLLELAERSGCADSVMAEIAQRLTEKSEEELEKALGRVEPALVLVCCLVIGAVLLSVMLPLMNIMSGIG